MRCLPCLAIILVGVCSASGQAVAGAWTRAEGDGLLIISSGRRVAPIAAFATGLPDDDANTTQVLAEYGVIEGLTLGATVFAELSTVDLSNSTFNAGVYVRKRLWQGEKSVFSAQLGYAHPLESVVEDPLGEDIYPSAPEVEFRLQYGHSFWGDWGNAFLAVDGGYDYLGNGEDDELHADLTVGYEPYNCCLALLSTYATVPVGREEATFKIAPSFAYTLYPEVRRNGKKPSGFIRTRTIQFGINYDLLNPDDGIGVQISIWQKF
ncbi:hypothetical protein KHP62_15345 [Rhodobacteraceae bacterium NNCM2]|nr:hypothetical protein [Coraliihabitans acroporae]